MEEKHWIDYILVIGTVATPILVILLTAFAWKYRKSLERKINLEENLRKERIEIYNSILEPFIILLMTEAAWESDKQNKNKDKNSLAMSKMLSLEYRRSASQLSLIGSDAVVNSYNDLMQHFYDNSDKAEKLGNDELRTIMLLLGNLLLEIRRSMGNETTKLDNWSMLEWFIKDVRKLRDGNLI